MSNQIFPLTLRTLALNNCLFLHSNERIYTVHGIWMQVVNKPYRRFQIHRVKGQLRTELRRKR